MKANARNNFLCNLSFIRWNVRVLRSRNRLRRQNGRKRHLAPDAASVRWRGPGGSDNHVPETAGRPPPAGTFAALVGWSLSKGWFRPVARGVLLMQIGRVPGGDTGSCPGAGRKVRPTSSRPTSPCTNASDAAGRRPPRPLRSRRSPAPRSSTIAAPALPAIHSTDSPPPSRSP
jgi:hypothetical protein